MSLLSRHRRIACSVGRFCGPAWCVREHLEVDPRFVHFLKAKRIEIVQPLGPGRWQWACQIGMREMLLERNHACRRCHKEPFFYRAMRLQAARDARCIQFSDAAYRANLFIGLERHPL